MKVILDEKLKGHAMLFDGPLDVIRHAKKANSGKDPFFNPEYQRWPGRVGRSWEDFDKFLHSPWNEAVAKIDSIINVVKKYVKPPKSIKRKLRWDENDGDVCVNRLLQGEPEFYRRPHRPKVDAPRSIALVANLENGKDGTSVNPSGLWFRSGVAIAIADMLEEAGYSCEVWIWNLGWYLFPKPNHKCFIAWKAKAAGAVVDKHAMADSMSYWFTTQAVIAVPAANPVGIETKSDYPLGAAIMPNQGVTDVEQVGMGEWIKYMDIDEGMQKVAVPMVYSWSWDSENSMPVQTARAVLRDIIGASD